MEKNELSISEFKNSDLSLSEDKSQLVHNFEQLAEKEMRLICENLTFIESSTIF
jgi:hypothetical protein